MLLLFDIDGTLLAGATRAHGQALDEALLEVHGVHTRGVPRPFSPAGRTDGEIARGLLLQAGVSAERIDDQADAVRRSACEIYARLLPDDLSEFVLPGIPELLRWLSERDDVVLGLVTGNYEPIARLKLGRAGVGKPFAGGPGGFGSDSEDRAALPGIARRRAGSAGVPYPREDTIVIGDTPRDIACARADGVRVVAVATGQFGIGELADADRAVADAAELGEVLAGELR